MEIFKNYIKLLMTGFLLISIGNTSFSQIDIQESTTGQSEEITCGYLVLKYLETNYFENLTDEIEIPQKITALADVFDYCQKFSSNSSVIQIEPNDLHTIPLPAILHYSSDHFVLIEKNNDSLFSIYDPGSPFLKQVGISYLNQNFSGKAILLNHQDQHPTLSLTEIRKTHGNYLHEFPPPNQGANEDKIQRGDKTDTNIPMNECRNGRLGGSPLFSFNPIILNIVLTDVPMWFSTGVGPDIKLKLVYNGNDQQEITGTAPSPTQYFPMGKAFSFSYSAFYHIDQTDANLITLVMPDGARETFTFSGNTSTPSHTNYYNKFEKYSIAGGYGYCLTIKESKLKYKFDNPTHNKLTSIEDRNGNVLNMVYNSQKNLISINNSSGVLVQFILNSDGRIVQATDPIGRTALFGYGYNTDNDYLTSITDMAGYPSTIDYASVQILDQSGSHSEVRIVSVTTPTGTSLISYQPTGVVGPGSLAYKFTFTNPMGINSLVSFGYTTGNNGITKVYDNNGQYDEYQVDLPNFRIDQIVKPNPASSFFYNYDTNGNKNSISVGTYETQFLYDSNGNITKLTDPLGNETNYSYDTNNNLVSIIDPENRQTSFTYDSNHNLDSISDAISQQSLAYFSNGNLQSITDANGYVTVYNYDSNKFLNLITYPNNSTTNMLNDSVGRPISLTSNGITLAYQYDNFDQITQIAYPDGSTRSFTYEFQYVTLKTDRIGRQIAFQYDDMNQIIQSEGPQGLINYDRDGNGNILSILINSQTTSYTYDNMNRMILQTNPNGTQKSFTYDELGNLQTRTDENGITTTYSYDYTLMTDIDYSDNTPDVEFDYNDNGEVIAITDGIGQTTYQYDTGGRLISKDGPFSDDLFAFNYDSLGNRTYMNLNNIETDYTYDNMGRINNVVSDYASAAYSYDNYNRLTSKIHGNGSSALYNYDALNRLTSLTNLKSNNGIISAFDYEYDNASMISKIADNAVNISNYEYDNAYQLTKEDVTDVAGKTLWNNDFAYDNMGNRISLNKNGVMDTYTYNVENQLTEMTKTLINVSGIVTGDSTATVYVEDIKAYTLYLGNNQLEFEAFNIPLDNGGDTIQAYAKVNEIMATVDSSKFICSTTLNPDGSINVELFSNVSGIGSDYINHIVIQRDNILFKYDDNGNLTQRQAPDDTTNYSYDAENRLCKIEYQNGTDEEYVYDGLSQRVKVMKNGILQKRYIYDAPFEAIAIIDSTNNIQYLTRGLSLGGGIGGIISTYNNQYGIIYNFYNHRGDVVNICNSNDTVLFVSSYDAFGTGKCQSGNMVHYFLFSSKEYNSNSGLSYYGYRFYSQEMGRWINKDPIGFSGGNNLFAFSLGNPINILDPLGLDCNQNSVWDFLNDYLDDINWGDLSKDMGEKGLDWMANDLPDFLPKNTKIFGLEALPALGKLAELAAKSQHEDVWLGDVSEAAAEAIINVIPGPYGEIGRQLIQPVKDISYNGGYLYFRYVHPFIERNF